MVDLKSEIGRVARSDAKVLITGESGSGKELVAQAIHNESSRADKAFVAVNCAGLPETLLESELFGHVRGSFTGAYRDKLGKLEMADSGTVFLDEIGEMTLRMQGLLLRFLETGELQKVGADHVTRRVNVRVVAATNRNLRDMIGQGLFREDLFYRLNVIHLSVPPLRERKAGHSRPCGALPPILLQERRCAPGGPSRHDGAAGRVLLAGQRPRAPERHRTASPSTAAARRFSRTIYRPKSSAARRRDAAETGAPSHR
jgi:hypothetical protein